MGPGGEQLKWRKFVTDAKKITMKCNYWPPFLIFKTINLTQTIAIICRMAGPKCFKYHLVIKNKLSINDAQLGFSHKA